jgi:hypothetical protein
LILLRFLPGFVLGVFLARLIGEATGLPGAWAAIALSGILGLGLGWLLSRYPIRETWPALILSAYLVSPEVAPWFMQAVVATTIVAFGINATVTVNGGRRVVPNDLVSRTTAATGFIMLSLVFFCLYVLTLAPDVLAADGGELQVVAAQLGVAHPPGFPLYVMLAHLMTRLVPNLSPAYAVNLFSAITSALAVGVVYLSGLQITRQPLPAVVAAIALGSATTYWSQATTANVRSLTGLFAALIVYVLVLFRIATSKKNTKVADRWLVMTALLMGFGLTHHVSLLFLILIGLVFILLVDRALIHQPWRWWRPIVASILGLSPLVYLPLRAGVNVRGAVPDLATLTGFLEHVLATGFRGDLFYYTDPAAFWLRMGVMGNVLTFQFSLFVLAGMLAGFILLVRFDRPLAWLLGGSFFLYVIVAATYRAPQTVEYMIPAYISAALMFAYAIRWLVGLIDRSSQFIGAGATLLVSVLVVCSLIQLPEQISASGARHESDSARAYAGRLLAEAPPESVILAHWHWATPLWYLQEVEGQRQDVEVRFVFPEGESYETTWERRTRESFAAGRPVITTYVPASPITEFPVPEPLGEALLYPQVRRDSLPADFIPTDLLLDAAIEVMGYRLSTTRVEPGEELVVEIAWRPQTELPSGAGLFVHLIDAGEQLVGQDDQQALAAGDVAITQFRLVPRMSPQTGQAELLIGATIPSEQTEEVEAARAIVTEVELTANSNDPLTQNRVFRRTIEPETKTLIGYDHDRTIPDRQRLYLHWRHDAGYYRTEAFDDGAIETMNLPAYRGPWGIPISHWSFSRERGSSHYVPFGQGIVWTGETMGEISPSPEETITLNQYFRSTKPLNRDYVVSVRLIGLEPDEYHWAWWDLRDSIPVLGAIPTLKWIEGSVVRSPHSVTVAPQASPGQVLTGALTLYDAFTNRPVPILDERITGQNPWLSLGRDEVKQ